MWVGPVSLGAANSWRRRRCVTEETTNARVITLNSPWIRQGLLTHHDATNNSGSWSKRKPPSTRDWPVSAWRTSGSRHSLASMVVPRTTHAWPGLLHRGLGALQGRG